MPLLLPGATLDTTFQYKNAILRQMIGKLVEKLLLLGLIMDGGQKKITSNFSSGMFHHDP